MSPIRLYAVVALIGLCVNGLSLGDLRAAEPSTPGQSTGNTPAAANPPSAAGQGVVNTPAPANPGVDPALVKKISDEVEKQNKALAAANLDSVRLMSFGLAPGVSMSILFPLGYIEDRRQGELSISGMSYVSFHPFYWRSKMSVKRAYCARSWAGSASKELETQVFSYAREIAERRASGIAPNITFILNKCVNNVGLLETSNPTPQCERAMLNIEEYYYYKPKIQEDVTKDDYNPKHSRLNQVFSVCLNDTNEQIRRECIINKFTDLIQTEIWKPGFASNCAVSLPGFYFGLTFPYTAQVLSPAGSAQRSITPGFSTGFSLSPSAYISILLGITINKYDEDSSNANDKKIHNQILGTLSIGGNLDILTKLLGK